MQFLQNNKIFKTFAIIAVAAAIIIVSAQSGFCAEDILAQVPEIQDAAANSEKNVTITKFVIAMAGVMLSSFVIFLGLTIYNKFFVDKRLFPNNNPDDGLNTPKTVDEAVSFFIKRNKLC